MGKLRETMVRKWGERSPQLWLGKPRILMEDMMEILPAQGGAAQWQYTLVCKAYQQKI